MTAWSLGLVLLAAGGALLSISEPQRVVEQPSFPLAGALVAKASPSPTPSPVPVPPPAPTRAPEREAPLRSAAEPDLDVASVLGPPP
ncbi:MAG: hypothetical protein JWN08_2241, partial [Frankiales bacterium]|nr:hypothetical protein [Frankiales bacterium]